MTDLLSLLQAATGPSRELDAEIALANGWTRLSHDLWRNGDDVEEDPPLYTASIDDALTLVPEGADFQTGSAKLIGRFWASIIMPKMEHKATAATPAIAIVIACLMAE